MRNVAQNLRTNGLSYDVIAASCGESFVNILNYADAQGDLPDSALDKLRRLDDALNHVAGRDPKEVTDIFENHVVTSTHKDTTVWLYLYEIWAFGLVSDEGLTAYIESVSTPRRLEDLAVEATGETGVAMDELPSMEHAAPSQFRAFYNTFRELSVR